MGPVLDRGCPDSHRSTRIAQLDSRCSGGAIAATSEDLTGCLGATTGASLWRNCVPVQNPPNQPPVPPTHTTVTAAVVSGSGCYLRSPQRTALRAPAISKVWPGMRNGTGEATGVTTCNTTHGGAALGRRSDRLGTLSPQVSTRHTTPYKPQESKAVAGLSAEIRLPHERDGGQNKC